MSEQTRSPVDNRVLRVWVKCSRYPAGTFVFSQIFARVAPFNSVIRPRVLEVRPGRARIAMRERRRLQQHLRSVHAGALFTLAECTSGLAMAASVPDTARIIVTDISIDFLKKAHGLLTAEADCDIPDTTVQQRHEVEVTISDEAGDHVARATIAWVVGPRPEAGTIT
jgi:uncharacterized protein (TIGR00369 family)